MELTLDQALQEGISAHKSGRLQDAERYYRAILNADPTHPDANHNLGVLALGLRKAESALPFFKKALELKPNVEEFWASFVTCLVVLGDRRMAEAALLDASKCGVSANTLSEVRANLDLPEEAMSAPSQQEINVLLEHFASAQLEAAEQCARSLSDKYPDHYLSWKILGAVFQKKGEFEEALESKQRAAELSPADPEAYYNLANAQKQLGKFHEAKVSYERAITLKPDYARALNNLGSTFAEMGEYVEAEQTFSRAISLEPNNPTHHNNLGSALEKRAEFEAAVSSHAHALKIKPDFAKAKGDLGRCLKYSRFKSCEQDLYPVIRDLLFSGNVRPSDVCRATLSLLKQEPEMGDLLRHSGKANWRPEIASVVASCGKIPLLYDLMGLTPLLDPEIERLLLIARKNLLLELGQLRLIPGLTPFLSALVLQCSTNEFVYSEADEETLQIKTLENKISEVVSLGEQPEILEVLCLACYRPLHSYKWCEKLVMPDRLSELSKRLIQDPIAELALARGIPQLEIITDKTSCDVRQQYEQSPYPRWIMPARRSLSKSMAEYCVEEGMELHSIGIKAVDAPAVLIAGCGTGQQPISTATNIDGCEVTAIDLSLASLAYAERHRRELEIDNIEFIQADLLDVDRLGKKFDVIQCSGVLHHMHDPAEGLRALERVLKPGGLLELGLYSEKARAAVVKAKAQIDSLKVEPSETGLREFRNLLIEEGSDVTTALMNFNDFYSLSEFRDLLFHVKEHQFSLLQIGDLLDAVGLKFCGFRNHAINTVFRLTHEAPSDLHDFALWDRFEEHNPNAFTGMYQFWCQKPQS